MKVNVGSGPIPLDGYTNIDVAEGADIQGDIRTLELARVEHVNASHVLEHLPHVDVIAALANMRRWMQPRGTITVEVPDMHAISQLGPEHPRWLVWTYGCQVNDGEYHRSGFSADSLQATIEFAGWKRVTVEAFVSDHRSRVGMPCLLAEATC